MNHCEIKQKTLKQAQISRQREELVKMMALRQRQLAKDTVKGSCLLHGKQEEERKKEPATRVHSFMPCPYSPVSTNPTSLPPAHLKMNSSINWFTYEYNKAKIQWHWKSLIFEHMSLDENVLLNLNCNRAIQICITYLYQQTHMRSNQQSFINK